MGAPAWLVKTGDRINDLLKLCFLGKTVPDWLIKERDWHEETMYMAHPTRMKEMADELEYYVYLQGYMPFNPFGCGKFKYCEGGRWGRAKTLPFGLALQERMCGYSGILGISAGVMGEIRDRLEWDKERRIRVFHDAGFDPIWDSEYEKLKLKPEFGDVFSDLRGRHYSIQLVGPSGIGKTYWIKKLERHFGRTLTRVKNVTTRPFREKDDKESYYLVTKDQFLTGKNNYRFLEYDDYFDMYYGSSLEEVRPILRTRNVICAMTPEGAKKWHECRFEINIIFILLKPVSEGVLVRNLGLGRRGETDLRKVKEKIAKAKDFVLPSEIRNITVPITGEDEYDEPRIFNAVRPFIK